MSTEQVRAVADAVRASVERVIVGKRDVIDLILVALLCEGHVLLEDVPGIGKTTLARSIARSLGCSFRRIQCTPDLLPSDVLGTTVYDARSSEFIYRPGPIHAQVVLADEINRVTPRTQSAFLEAMEERQVSVEGETRPLPRPFLVLATQNPIELEGTFPLPEAQLDRFLLRVKLGYPEELEEREILLRFRESNPLAELQPVVSADELLELQREIRRVHVSEAVEEYIVRLVRATRDHPTIELGASPRASLGLYRSGQALAALEGRGFVLPDDVKRLAPFVLGHRVLLKAGTRLRGRSASEVVDEVVGSVPVPVEA
ncbi:MAG: ATPase [Dehalococcoidia bacterium]|nr:MAG: ATPase [Dehalococcoidia bacterium]